MRQRRSRGGWKWVERGVGVGEARSTSAMDGAVGVESCSPCRAKMRIEPQTMKAIRKAARMNQSADLPEECSQGRWQQGFAGRKIAVRFRWGGRRSFWLPGGLQPFGKAQQQRLGIQAQESCIVVEHSTPLYRRWQPFQVASFERFR